MDRIFDGTVRRALERTAARDANLGAGPQAALAAAGGAALATMAVRYADEDDPRIDELRRAGEHLAQLADADGPGFAPMMEAWALPADDPDRAARLAEAARTASAVPLRICRTGVRIAGIAADVFRDGRKDLRGDAAAAAHLADAAVQAAALLVRLNSGPGRTPDLVDEAWELAQASRALTDPLRVSRP